MKNTYLVFIDPSDPKSGLRVATKKEWNQILDENRGAEQGKRRYFICDRFVDCGVLDRMYIEATKSEFDKWHSQTVETERKRKLGKQYGFVSLQQILQDEDGLSFCDALEDSNDMEEDMCDKIRIEHLRDRLSAWKPWAVEMLDLYLSGDRKDATVIISKRYGKTERTVQRWKELFEAYVIRFFEKN